jgi:hypothetical protein
VIKDGAGNGGSCGVAHISGVAGAVVFVRRVLGAGGDSKGGAAKTKVHARPRGGARPQGAAPARKLAHSHRRTGRSVLVFVFY